MNNILGIMVDGLVYFVLIGAIIKLLLGLMNTIFAFNDPTAVQQQGAGLVLKLGLFAGVSIGLGLLVRHYTDHFSYFFS